MFWNLRLESLQNYLNAAEETSTNIPFFNSSTASVHQKFNWIHSFFAASLLLENNAAGIDPNAIINQTLTLINRLNITSLFYNQKI